MADNIVSVSACWADPAEGSSRLTVASLLAEVGSDEAAELAQQLAIISKSDCGLLALRLRLAFKVAS